MYGSPMRHQTHAHRTHTHSQDNNINIRRFYRKLILRTIFLSILCRFSCRWANRISWTKRVMCAARPHFVVYTFAKVFVIHGTIFHWKQYLFFLSEKNKKIFVSASVFCTFSFAICLERKMKKKMLLMSLSMMVKASMLRGNAKVFKVHLSLFSEWR